MSEQLTKKKPMHWLGNGLWHMWPSSDKLNQSDFSHQLSVKRHTNLLLSVVDGRPLKPHTRWASRGTSLRQRRREQIYGQSTDRKAMWRLRDREPSGLGPSSQQHLWAWHDLCPMRLFYKPSFKSLLIGANSNKVLLFCNQNNLDWNTVSPK